MAGSRMPFFPNGDGFLSYPDENTDTPSGSSDYGYQYPNGQNHSFQMPNVEPTNNYGFDYSHSSSLSPYESFSYSYGSQTVPDAGHSNTYMPWQYGSSIDINDGPQNYSNIIPGAGQVNACTPLQYGSSFNINEVSQNFPYQGGYPQAPIQNYPPMMLEQGFDSDLPVAGQVGLPLEQNANGENELFGEDREDSDATEEEVEDSDDVDNGEFVVSDIKGMVNIERPGVTREDNGFLEWFHPKNEEWHPAVPHHNIRAQLIAEAQARHPNQSYLHPDLAGSGPNDITAFHMDYQNWGTERDDRPKILYRFDPPTNRQRRVRPGPMMYRGKIVLNHQNNPVLDWNIPVTLSSKTSGSHMEAWKRTFGLSQEDMRARMPRYTFEGLDGARKRVPLPDKNGAINMPMMRFRDRAGCIAWSKRPGSDKLRTNVLSLMRSEGFDPLVNGSSEGFGRDLTFDEQLAVKKDNKKSNSTEAPKSKSTKRTGASDTSSNHIPRPRKRLYVNEDEEGQGIQSNTGMSHPDGAETSARRTVNFAQQVQANMRKRNQRSARGSRRRVTQAQRPIGQRPASSDNEAANDPSRHEHAEDADLADAEYDLDLDFDGMPNVIPDGAESAYDGRSVPQDHLETQSCPDSRPLPNPIRPSSGGPQVSNRSMLAQSRSFDGPTAHENDVQGHRRKHGEYQNEFEDAGLSDSQPLQKRRYVRKDPSLVEIHPVAPASRENKPTSQSKASQNDASTSQVTAHNIDCRKLAPDTESERRSLDEALEVTREAYFEYTGDEAPTTDRNASYFSQWLQIRRSFEEYDWSEEPEQEAPYLCQLPPWYTSIEDWPPHPKDSLYYEAWKLGHRAPRINGEVIDLPGEFLVRISKMDEERREKALAGALRSMNYEPTKK